MRTSARKSNLSVCASMELPVSTYRVRYQIAAQSHKLRHRRNRRSLISYQVPISEHSGDQFLYPSSLTCKLHHAAELGDEVIANLGATSSTRQVGVDLHWGLSKLSWKHRFIGLLTSLSSVCVFFANCLKAIRSSA